LALALVIDNPTFRESAAMSPDDARTQKDGDKEDVGSMAQRDPGSGRLGLAINDTIGKRLQAHYKVLAEEPLPDRFMVLLAQLRAKELKS
jgi:hypothetical protein